MFLALIRHRRTRIEFSALRTGEGSTFAESLARLTGEEQKAVKTTAFGLQLNPANPGMSFPKLDRARNKNFWSLRVNAGIRLIAHRSDASLLQGWRSHRPPQRGAIPHVLRRSTLAEPGEHGKFAEVDES